ncbi:MAG: (Fe-S)-binding protein [Promethearchaeota archaeon]
MSSLWVKAWKNTPRIDCGLCGAANCSSFARSLVVGELDISSCPILKLPEFQQMREQLDINRGREPALVGKPAAKLPEGGMLLTRPCQDTDEKVMAELRVFNGVEAGRTIHYGVFDPKLLCSMMDCLSASFELTRCSRDLGYGRAEIEDMSITILQDGRINMRRVSDEDRVRELFGIIERAILGSAICNCCGSDLLTVLLGIVEPRRSETHPVLMAGSSFSLDQEVIDRGPSKLDVAGLPSGCAPLAEKVIRTRHAHILSMAESLLNDKRAIMADEDEAFPCQFVRMLVANKDPSVVTSLLICLGSGFIQQNAMNGLIALNGLVLMEDETLGNRVKEWLQIAASGNNLPSYSPSWTPTTIMAYAHVTRFSRAVRLFSSV